MKQLVSYIALAAPATRRYAEGNEAFLRPEIGFTPQWFHRSLGVDFSEKWHTNPAHRRETVLLMREEIKKRFPDTPIGLVNQPDRPLDLLTGMYGACAVAAIYGIPIHYEPDQWPTSRKEYLTKEQTDNLQPPVLDRNEFFVRLMEQLDWIANREGPVAGFMNWQGILNNAYRLRGETIFTDLIENPERCMHLFECLCSTMTEAVRRVQERQRQSGVVNQFFTVSNCLVNMISPKQYERCILPFDRKIAETFECIGIHNCAWKADPYLEAYATVPNVGYIDMGMESNLSKAKELFPKTRRAVMYSPTRQSNASENEIESDLIRIAQTYAPGDVVFADVEWDTPDERVRFVIEACERIGGGFL